LARWFDDPEVRAIARSCWLAITEHFPYVELGMWVLMPDHLHGIIRMRDGVPWKLYHGEKGKWLGRDVRGLPDTLLPRTRRNAEIHQSTISPQRRTLAVVIRTFKAAVTCECRRAGFAEFAWMRAMSGGRSSEGDRICDAREADVVADTNAIVANGLPGMIEPRMDRK
jgi:hypothetical protein